jgi:ribosomal protein L11 methylase PrmA
MRKTIAFALAVLVAGGMSIVPTRAQDKDKEKLKVDIEVPFVPTNEKVVTAMLKLAAVKEGETVYDLGCGDGRIVITAVKEFKAKRGLGVDFNPERLKDCEKRMKDEKLTDDQRKALTFKQGDVLKMTPEDFKDVDVVTLYLLPEVNLRLKPVLQKGLKNGARIVSHDFDMGDWKADKEEKVESDRGTHTIYLWTIKKDGK